MDIAAQIIGLIAEKSSLVLFFQSYVRRDCKKHEHKEIVV